MSRGGISEGIVEQAALDWFRSLGYATLPGAVLAPGGTAPERSSYDQVVLTGRLRDAALRINPDLPAGVVEHAATRLLRAESQNALAENERVHRLLTGGVPVEHRTATGEVRTALVWLVDWEKPAVNDWLVVHQFTVVEAGKNRRADVVVFLNGLPVGLLELKNPGDAHATLRGAWNQVQTYRRWKCCCAASLTSAGSWTCCARSSSTPTSRPGWSSGSRSTTSTGRSTPRSSRRLTGRGLGVLGRAEVRDGNRMAWPHRRPGSQPRPRGVVMSTHPPAVLPEHHAGSGSR